MQSESVKSVRTNLTNDKVLQIINLSLLRKNWFLWNNGVYLIILPMYIFLSVLINSEYKEFRMAVYFCISNFKLNLPFLN